MDLTHDNWKMGKPHTCIRALFLNIINFFLSSFFFHDNYVESTKYARARKDVQNKNLTYIANCESDSSGGKRLSYMRCIIYGI